MFGFANFLLLALFAAAVFDLIFALARGDGLRGALHGLWNTPHLLFQKEREKERIYQPIIHTGDQLLMTDLAIIKR